MGTPPYRTSAAPALPVRRQSVSEVVLAVIATAAAILLVHSAFHSPPQHADGAGPAFAGVDTGPGPTSRAMTLGAPHPASPATVSPTFPRRREPSAPWSARGGGNVGLDLRPVHNEVPLGVPLRGFGSPTRPAAASWAPPPSVDTGYLRSTHTSSGGMRFGKGH